MTGVWESEIGFRSPILPPQGFHASEVSSLRGDDTMRAGRDVGAWGWAPAATLITAGAALTLRFFPLYRLWPPCPFRTLTGWPCPTCGGTRCALALARLDLAGAFAFNPLLFVVAFALVTASGLRLAEILLGRSVLSPAPLLRRPALLRVGVAALAAANWAYLVIAAGR